MNPYWASQYQQQFVPATNQFSQPQFVPATNQVSQPQFLPQYAQQQQLMPQFMQQPQQTMSQQQCGAPSIVPTVGPVQTGPVHTTASKPQVATGQQNRGNKRQPAQKRRKNKNNEIKDLKAKLSKLEERFVRPGPSAPPEMELLLQPNETVPMTSVRVNDNEMKDLKAKVSKLEVCGQVIRQKVNKTQFSHCV